MKPKEVSIYKPKANVPAGKDGYINVVSYPSEKRFWRILDRISFGLATRKERTRIGQEAYNELSNQFEGSSGVINTGTSRRGERGTYVAAKLTKNGVKAREEDPGYQANVTFML